MIPGFPMDGGRVLRAFLARTRPYPEATEQAAGVGKVVAVGLALGGILLFNPLLVALAGFLYIAATSEAKGMAARAALENVPVWEAMTPAARVEVVDERRSVAALLDRMFEGRTTWYPVVRGEELVGTITLEDARDVPRVERKAVTVGEIANRDPPTVGPNTTLAALLRRGGARDRLLVRGNGQFLGVLREADIESARRTAGTPKRG